MNYSEEAEYAARDKHKIAKWLNKGPIAEEYYYSDTNYSNDDGLAIILLPVLVERGYEPEMWHNSLTKTWCVQIFYPTKRTKTCEVAETTIAQAIYSAVIQLIEKEAEK